MAIFISAYAYSVIAYIHIVSYSLAALSAIVSLPFLCCCCCFTRRFRCLHDAVVCIADYVVCFLKKKEDERGAHFVVFNYRAPVCYAYYLVFTFVLLMSHGFLAFWNATIEFLPLDVCHNNVKWFYTDVYNNVANVEQYCLELNVLKGLEALISVLSFSIVAMALTTWLILCISKGSKSRKCGIGCTCRVSLVITLQIIGLFFLRIAVNFYISGLERKGEMIGLDSTYTILAVFDAISLASLTPWTHFESVHQYNITHPKALKQSGTDDSNV